MTWDKERLAEIARKRSAARAKLQPVEQAALAYARWQGLTAEADVDKVQQKLALDRALEKLDGLDDAAWLGLANVAQDLGEPVVVGLLRYSMARNAGQLMEQTQATAAVLDQNDGPPSARGPRKRRRERSR